MGSEARFSKIIGYIEEIIMEEEYLALNDGFLEENYAFFDDNEENKLIYTEIFNNYAKTLEKHIEERLNLKNKGFSMEEFEKELKAREGRLDGQIFEILETFYDFSAFKNMVLDYKLSKEGAFQKLSEGLLVTKYEIKNTTTKT